MARGWGLASLLVMGLLGCGSVEEVAAPGEVPPAQQPAGDARAPATPSVSATGGISGRATGGASGQATGGTTAQPAGGTAGQAMGGMSGKGDGDDGKGGPGKPGPDKGPKS